MHVWHVLHTARWKYRTQNDGKTRHLGTIAQICRAISSQLRYVSTIGKKLVKQQYLPTRPYNMVNFGPLAAEIVSLVWGTAANFKGFRVLAALLHVLQQWASAKFCGVEQRAPPVFGRAAITLGIGPHSSLSFKKFFDEKIQSSHTKNLTVWLTVRTCRDTEEKKSR